MSSKVKKGKGPKKRVARATSNVFAMFDQAQVQEFKEAFNMIDQNRDGFIDKVCADFIQEDLRITYQNFGREVTDEELEEMISEAPGSINFTIFLTMFGEKMTGTDPEDIIKNAFSCFDEKNTGKIYKDDMIEAFTTMGDRFTKEEVEIMMHYAPVDSAGYINYGKFAHIIKHGVEDETQA